MSEQKRHQFMDVSSTTRKRMLAVKGLNTGPEIRVRKALHQLGYRFRLHRKDLPGTPDIVIPRFKKIILVHGCFWHGHFGCKRSKLPINNAKVWYEKVENNRIRDQKNILLLNELGWDVRVIWECETKDTARLNEKLLEIMMDMNDVH